MKDKEIEQRALELYPNKTQVRRGEKGLNVNNAMKRQAYIKGMKEMRDRYERKIALIKLTQMGEPQSSEVDLMKLSKERFDQMYNYLEENGKVPNWWKGFNMVSLSAIQEFQANQDKLREAAEKVVEVYDSGIYSSDMVELLNPIEELKQALKQD